MNLFLAVGVVLAVFVALSSAQCYNRITQFDFRARVEVCEHKGDLYKIGAQWTFDCEECSCDKSGMTCCSTIPRPVQYDKVNCEAILDRKSCRYNVVKRGNPNEKCEVRSMVL